MIFKGEMHKKAYELIWLRFFRFSTIFFKVFSISCFLAGGLNKGGQNVMLIKTGSVKKDSERNSILQGILYCFDILWRPRRPSKNNFLIMIKASVYSRSVAIWVSSTSFQKSDIGWPHQPPRDKLLKMTHAIMRRVLA